MKYFQEKSYCQSKIIQEKWIFQFDEDDDTWDEVCEELGIEIDDSSTSDVSTNEDSSDDMEADSREGACATSKEGSTTGEMTHREEKKTEGSTSSSSDSDVKVMRKMKCILIESESSSDEKFEDWNDQTEETHEKMMEKKPKRIVIEVISLYKCPECEDTSKSEGKTYSHMAQCHGMQNFEYTFCHFSMPNKTSMRNHRKMYCRELKNQPEKSSTDTLPRPKLVIKKVDGVTFYKCALCNYMGKSFGKIDGHMVMQHGYEKFTCDYCKFSTPNSTLMHNHKKLYCRSLKK